MSTSILAMQAVPMALIARQLGHSDTRMNRAPLCASRAELRGGHYPGELQHEDLRALLQRSEMADLFDSCLSAHWEAYQPSRFQLREAWLVIKPKQAIFSNSKRATDRG
jgi:hypothetical protein